MKGNFHVRFGERGGETRRPPGRKVRPAPTLRADVWRMRMVENLIVDENGHASYRFRPSSPLCPIAIPLAQMIKYAVSLVPGVTGQTIEVADYIQAELLTELLNLES
jgi:hypothetical protein